MVLAASATSRGATGGATLPGPPSGGTGVEARMPGPDAGPVDRTGAERAVPAMKLAVATWYGPGLYGRHTACGLVLRRSTRGVAHRNLPCGKLVRVFYRGRLATVTVIDRGPRMRGVSWDLAEATARELGFVRTGRIKVLH
jgi:rare lipoprotein A (peptidoglycan hydrolase)